VAVVAIGSKGDVLGDVLMFDAGYPPPGAYYPSEV